MKNKIFKRIFSGVVAATLLAANIVSVSAAGTGSAGTVSIKHYLNDTLLENDGIVFVGEKFKTKITADITEKFTGWGLAVKFDQACAEIVPYSDSVTAVSEFIVSDVYDLYDGVYGVKMQEFIDTWAGGNGNITVNSDMPLISNDQGYVWMYGNAANVGSSASLTGDATIVEFNFEAKAAGNPNVRFATASDSPYDIGTPKGYLFSYGNAGTGNAEEIDVAQDVKTIQIKEKPDAPTNLEWNGNKATWSDVVSRGYYVTLYNGEDIVKTTEVLAEDENEYNFTDDFKTPGDYTFVVTAKGCANDTDSVKSEPKRVEIQLDAPETPEWSEETSGLLEWAAVNNASGYEITIYKKDGEGNFVQYGQAVSTNTNSAQLKTNMAEVGEYKVKVKAVGTGGYTESELSPESAVFYSGTKISGYVKLDHEEDMEGDAPDHSGLNIALYEETDDGNGVITRTKVKEDISLTNGSFLFQAVPAGTYDVVVSGAGVITRIIEDVNIQGEKFVFATPIEIWPGNIFTDDDIASGEGTYPYGVNYVNANDIALMVSLIGNSSASAAYNEVADFNLDGVNQTQDLNILVHYAGKNSVPGDRSSYPTYVTQ